VFPWADEGSVGAVERHTFTSSRALQSRTEVRREHDFAVAELHVRETSTAPGAMLPASAIVLADIIFRAPYRLSLGWSSMGHGSIWRRTVRRRSDGSDRLAARCNRARDSRLPGGPSQLCRKPGPLREPPSEPVEPNSSTAASSHSHGNPTSPRWHPSVPRDPVTPAARDSGSKLVEALATGHQKRAIRQPSGHTRG
jgi:hypothetical protein